MNLNLKRSKFILFEWYRDYTLKLLSPVFGELEIISIFAVHNLYKMGYHPLTPGNSGTTDSLN